MSEVHPKLKEIIFEKISEDVCDKEILTNESDFWILDVDSRNWFLQATSSGQLFYNQKFFESYLSLFSINTKTLSKIIGEWFESGFELPLRMTSRKQNSMEYYISKFILKESSSLNQNNRFGFPYGFVKKYISLKKYKGRVFVEDYLPLS
jgi:hypothetical protein